MAKLGTFSAAQVWTAAELNAGAAAWTTWTPTLTNITVGNGTQVAKYAFFGRTVFAKWRFTLGSTSVMSSGPTISLPVAMADSLEMHESRVMAYDASAFLPYPGAGYVVGASFVPQVVNTAGTYAVLTAITATVPFTWTTSDYLQFLVTYEATS